MGAPGYSSAATRSSRRRSHSHSLSHTYSLNRVSLRPLPSLSRLCTTTHDLPLPSLYPPFPPFSFQNSFSRSSSPLFPFLSLHSFSPLRFLCTFSPSIVIKVRSIPSQAPSTLPIPPFFPDMDCWRVAVLGDGGVGKTALAVQVRTPSHPLLSSSLFLTCDSSSLHSTASLVSLIVRQLASLRVRLRIAPRHHYVEVCCCDSGTLCLSTWLQSVTLFSHLDI